MEIQTSNQKQDLKLFNILYKKLKEMKKKEVFLLYLNLFNSFRHFLHRYHGDSFILQV
jgi:hypothetical protein